MKTFDEWWMCDAMPSMTGREATIPICAARKAYEAARHQAQARIDELNAENARLESAINHIFTAEHDGTPDDLSKAIVKAMRVLDGSEEVKGGAQ